MSNERGRLRAGVDTVWAVVLHRLRLVVAWQRWIKIAVIAGTIVGAVGGGWDGSMVSAEHGLTAKGLMIWCGALVAGLGTLVLLFGEDDVVALIDAAHRLSDDARDFVEERDRLLAQLRSLAVEADVLDAKRRERLVAIERMLEVVEAAMLHEVRSDKTAPQMLVQAIQAVRRAIDYQGADFFTLSIFKREDRRNGDGERLYRIAAEWSDPSRRDADGRSWGPGQGYTGVAWAQAMANPAAIVIEPDTSLPYIITQYPVPHRDPAREQLYLSVAAIPILIGKEDGVWGVVTATFDRKGVFSRDGDHIHRQNIEVIRDIARCAGLLAGLDRLPVKMRSDGPRISFPWAGWTGGGADGRNA